MLKAYGLPLPESGLARTEKEAAELARKIGYPVVLKVSSPQIIHKSDAGGVEVGLKSDAEVRSAFRRIKAGAKKFDPKAEVRGVIVSEMVSGGREMIVGSKAEPGFGQVLMLGMGGIYVEALKDVTFRIAPVSPREASSMAASLQASRLLSGVRGEKPSDAAALSECVQRLSQLVSDLDVRELDMNPVLVLEKGCRVLDVRIGI